MTIREAICISEQLNPDQFPEEDKVRWLSNLDGQLKRDIFDTRQGLPAEEFAGYTMEDLDRELLVPAPYDDEIYPAFLIMKGAFYNNESVRYENAMVMYNNAVASFQSFWIRSHATKGPVRFRM